MFYKKSELVVSRHLIFGLLIFFSLSCTARAQINPPISQEDPIDHKELEAAKEMARGWPEAYSRPFLAALSLDVEESPQEVLEMLSPVASLSDVPPLLMALQARAFEAKGDSEKSADIYRQAIAKAGGKIGDFPWNLHLELGRLLLLKRQTAEAMTRLELAWQIDAYQRKDRSETYGLLALAYQGEGRMEEARQAVETAISCDPMEKVLWDVRADLLRGGEPRSDYPTPPWVPAPADVELRKILWYGYPFDWEDETKWEGIDAYLEYARALRAAGRVNAADEYQAAIMLKALGPFYMPCRKGDPSSCLNDLATLTQDSEYQKRAPLFIRGYVLLLQFRRQVQLEDYLHAIAALEELVDLKGAEYMDEAELRRMTINLQSELFGWVSFDPKTGAPRTSDPDDFIELYPEATMKKIEKINGSALGEKQGHNPYGMVSPSEDDANVAARIFMAEEEEEEKESEDKFFSKKTLQSLIAARIRERNFELPVKFLLHDQGYKFLEEPLQASGDTLRKRLDAAMATAGDEVPEQTLIGYAVGCRLVALLKRLPEDKEKKKD